MSSLAELLEMNNVDNGTATNDYTDDNDGINSDAWYIDQGGYTGHHVTTTTTSPDDNGDNDPSFPYENRIFGHGYINEDGGGNNRNSNNSLLMFMTFVTVLWNFLSCGMIVSAILSARYNRGRYPSHSSQQRRKQYILFGMLIPNWLLGIVVPIYLAFVYGDSGIIGAIAYGCIPIILPNLIWSIYLDRQLNARRQALQQQHLQALQQQQQEGKIVDSPTQYSMEDIEQKLLITKHVVVAGNSSSATTSASQKGSKEDLVLDDDEATCFVDGVKDELLVAMKGNQDNEDSRDTTMKTVSTTEFEEQEDEGSSSESDDVESQLPYPKQPQEQQYRCENNDNGDDSENGDDGLCHGDQDNDENESHRQERDVCDVEKSISHDDTDDIESQVQTPQHQQQQVLSQSQYREGGEEADNEGHHNNGNSTPTCPICLECYKVGDIIAYSRNPKCQHVYHKNCIIEWIQSSSHNSIQNEECPMCRMKFVGSGGCCLQTDGDEEEEAV